MTPFECPTLLPTLLLTAISLQPVGSRAMKTLYTARAHNKGGRDGRATAADGNPDLVIKPPQELGGPADTPEATNPEELLALGFDACFLSALPRVARQQ